MILLYTYYNKASYKNPIFQFQERYLSSTNLLQNLTTIYILKFYNALYNTIIYIRSIKLAKIYINIDEDKNKKNKLL